MLPWFCINTTLFIIHVKATTLCTTNTFLSDCLQPISNENVSRKRKSTTIATVYTLGALYTHPRNLNCVYVTILWFYKKRKRPVNWLIAHGPRPKRTIYPPMKFLIKRHHLKGFFLSFQNHTPPPLRLINGWGLSHTPYTLEVVCLF